MFPFFIFVPGPARSSGEDVLPDEITTIHGNLFRWFAVLAIAAAAATIFSTALAMGYTVATDGYMELRFRVPLGIMVPVLLVMAIAIAIISGALATVPYTPAKRQVMVTTTLGGNIARWLAVPAALAVSAAFGTTAWHLSQRVLDMFQYRSQMPMNILGIFLVEVLIFLAGGTLFLATDLATARYRPK